MVRGIRAGDSILWLGAAPLLLVCAVLAWYVSDRLVLIGPFDRAQVGWVIVVPLIAIAPGVAALVERRTALVRQSRRVVAGVAIAIVAFVVVGLALTVTYLDCHPVGGPLDVVPRALPIGLVAALAYVLAYAVASVVARRRAGLGFVVVRRESGIRVLLAGAATWLVLAALGLVVLAASFPALTCAPRP